MSTSPPRSHGPWSSSRERLSSGSSKTRRPWSCAGPRHHRASSKKTEDRLLTEVERLISSAQSAFSSRASEQRGRRLLLSAMLALGRRTVTGLITTSARQHLDWSADYRLLSRDRVDVDELFSAVRRELVGLLAPDQPLVVALDDTKIRKTGRRIPDAAWHRDPMSPPFRTNLMWGHRLLALSAIWPPSSANPIGRAIPIHMSHAPAPPKPPRDASEEELAQHRKAAKASGVAARGARKLTELRQQLDTDGDSGRLLVALGDGGFTNRSLLRDLPERTHFIGRIRDNARLYAPAEQGLQPAVGRKRRYGARLPRPKEIMRDPAVPWRTVEVFLGTTTHTLRFKALSPVLWKPAGYERPLTLIIIAPLQYRLRKHSRVLYRQPAFLICTDPALPPEDIVRWYIRRWDIEINFRDCKQLFGIAHPQVRNPRSVATAAPFLAAAYALLLAAATRLEHEGRLHNPVPPERWRRKPRVRQTTADLRRQLRHELWAEALPNFNSLASTPHPDTKPPKLPSNPLPALYYARP